MVTFLCTSKEKSLAGEGETFSVRLRQTRRNIKKQKHRFFVANNATQNDTTCAPEKAKHNISE